MAIGKAAIVEGLRDLGLEGRFAEVHSSLSSFGHVKGGAMTIVNALDEVCDTILVPTFSEMGRTSPPPEDRPAQNGSDYSYFDRLGSSEPDELFDSETFTASSPIEGGMGAIPKALLKGEGARRSKHPSVSRGALGEEAKILTIDHASDDPNAPLKRITKEEGVILLLGVSLSKCTAVHLAEELSGRRPFVRWTKHSDGVVRRMREYGCSDGFDAFEEHLTHLSQVSQIGQCRAVAYPMAEFLDSCARLIRSDPEMTICKKHCERCQDAVMRGPED